MSLAGITDALVADLDGLGFGPPVNHVHNPLVYARAAWDKYCERYGQGPRDVLLIGNNPGPFGLSNSSKASLVSSLDCDTTASANARSRSGGTGEYDDSADNDDHP